MASEKSEIGSTTEVSGGEWEPGYRPANGTEGDIFRSQWCSNCSVDHDGGWHTPDFEGDDSCPILMDALFGEHSYPNPEGPPQWQHRGGYGRGSETRCTEFKGPCSCPSARSPFTGEYVNLTRGEPHLHRCLDCGYDGRRSDKPS